MCYQGRLICSVRREREEFAGVGVEIDNRGGGWGLLGLAGLFLQRASRYPMDYCFASISLYQLSTPSV